MDTASLVDTTHPDSLPLSSLLSPYPYLVVHAAYIPSSTSSLLTTWRFRRGLRGRGVEVQGLLDVVGVARVAVRVGVGEGRVEGAFDAVVGYRR